MLHFISYAYIFYIVLTISMGKIMDIDSLTYGELKQIANLFNRPAQSSGLVGDYIGKYVIVRSRNEGVNAGIVKAADDTGVVLSDARRIWYHRPKDKAVCWYEGVAQTGLSDDSKVSCAVPEKAIVEDYSITVCTAAAEKSIREIATYEQN